MPILSIITINYNDVKGLKKTINSVFAQTFTQYEYIVIDGGSADDSKEYIEQCTGKLAYWVSEKDGGIFNAMNKGIAKAQGDYLLFLNSGDYLHDNEVLDKVFATHTREDIIYGNVIWQPGNYNGVYPDSLTFEHFINNTLPHQGSFIKKELFNTVGLYDEQYAINSDWSFFLLAVYKFNCSYRHIDLIISYCNTDGISLQPGSWEKITAMRRQVIEKHFSAFANEYKTFDLLKNELSLVKRTRGYRLHIQLRKMFNKYFWGKENSAL